MSLFILLFIFLAGCNNSFTKESKLNPVKNNILQVKDSIIYRKFEYPINNKDASDFAYIDGDLFDGGIKSIIIYGDYCLFVDEVHRNIKKINLKDGTKSVSNALLDRPGRSLVDLTIHNDLIYVSTFQKKIFVLDSNLKLVRTIELKTFGYHQLFFQGIKKNNLLVFISVQDTLIEIDPLGKEINRKRVIPYPYTIGDTLIFRSIRMGEFVNDTLVMGLLDYELYYYTYFERNEDSYVRGKKYRITQKGNKDIFVNDKYEIQLATPYTHLENTDIHFINDLDFDDNYLIIFEVTPPSITIHVYTIN